MRARSSSFATFATWRRRSSAFNRKRGTASFGAENAGSDEEFIKRLRVGALKLQDTWREAGDRAVLVRYEDLIADPMTTLERVLRYLGEDETQAAKAMVEEACAQAFDDILPTFGYEPTLTTAAGEARG